MILHSADFNHMQQRVETDMKCSLTSCLFPNLNKQLKCPRQCYNTSPHLASRGMEFHIRPIESINKELLKGFVQSLILVLHLLSWNTLVHAKNLNFIVKI